MTGVWHCLEHHPTERNLFSWLRWAYWASTATAMTKKCWNSVGNTMRGSDV